MTPQLRFAAISACISLLAGCADQEGQGFVQTDGSSTSFAATTSDPDPATTPTAAVTGKTYRLFSVAGIGDVRMEADRMTTSDGQSVPFREVGPGVYAFASPQTKLSNGKAFCGGQPVTHFTWHQNLVGHWIMNVGAWNDAPERPANNVSQAEGNCGVFTYQET